MSEHATIIGFRSRKTVQRHPSGLMEAVYSAGSVALRADDHAARAGAGMLAAFGLLVIDEVAPDGALTRLASSREFRESVRPWRVARPALGAVPEGTPEAVASA